MERERLEAKLIEACNEFDQFSQKKYVEFREKVLNIIDEKDKPEFIKKLDILEFLIDKLIQINDKMINCTCYTTAKICKIKQNFIINEIEKILDFIEKFYSNKPF